ncbi:MAG: hypothetical protein CMJ18_09965 [Phycisphaeraceae bacterium]|nr:hypothetical protein [Phycisphaeraceae bacterium]
MEYRTLGSSGLQVSPICLGTMTFGTPVAEPEAIRLVHESIDLGINFIDTANSYEGYDRVVGSSGGVAEKILGNALHDRRDRVVLATKVCSPLGPGPQDRGLSAAHITRELDRSLENLRTDYLDLYIIHWPDRLTPLETMLEAMDRAVRQGKVRCFGSSNHTAAQLCEMLWIADVRRLMKVVASQIPYSMLTRHFHNDLEFCAAHDISVTPYQSLQGGLLTGKYKRGAAPPAGSRAAEKPEWVATTDDALHDRLEALGELAKEAGVPVVQYVLAWTLDQPAMTSLVYGTKRIEQVRDAIAALEVKIPEAHHERIDELFPRPWRQADPIRG